MDLRQLRYFVAVAERGGFGAAASALNVAQSALSRHIKQLEHELGGALLERGARGVTVTESGKVLRVRLELSEGLTEAMSDRLLRAELDIAIVTMPQPNDHLDYETLVVEQVFLIGPPRDPLLQNGRITRREFNTLRAAVLPLSRNPFPPEVPSSLRVDGSTPMKRIAGSGLGYGLLPFSGIHQEVTAKTLSAALVPWLRADRVMALPRGRPVSRATREVVAALKDICRDLIQKGTILTVSGRSRSA
jgi:LysR family nitrogen assimilation transcriptional regulator